jgi:hypothetical protein
VGSVGGHPIWHVVVGMCIPFVINVAVAKLSARRARTAAAPSTTRGIAQPSRRQALMALAACSLAAGVIHLAVCPEHFEEATAFGLFFALAAAAQVAWAWMIFTRPSRSLLIAGAAGNLAVVTLWVITRTAGLPFGPHPWSPEAIGALDGVSGVLELVITFGATLIIHSDRPLSVRSLP